MAPLSPLLALPIAGAIATAAWRAGALTGPGAIAATVVGAAILATTGWPGGAVLLAFFVPSSAVGRIGLGRPSASDARGERRDPVQVAANGGAAAAGGFAEWLEPGLGFWMLTASLAAAAADTWATSIGRISPRQPRDLLTGMRVLRGTSGAVSLVGSLGAIAGAAMVAGVAALVAGSLALFTAATAIGVGGMLADSLLGATLQARFVCPACGVASERQVHRCGARTVRNGGLGWLDNDGVNALATTAAALAGGVAWLSLAR
jgi:uncharacterized protein (TIGR00297 family)